MQALYMIIGRNALFLYERDGSEYNRLFIEGNPEFRYQNNSVRKDIEDMLKSVMEEYNLDSGSDHCSEIAFTVVANADAVVTKDAVETLGEYLSQIYKLDSLIPDIIKELYADEKLLIKEYGVNFDGINYRMVNGTLQKAEYDLLGYTLQEDALIRHIG